MYASTIRSDTSTRRPQLFERQGVPSSQVPDGHVSPTSPDDDELGASIVDKQEQHIPYSPSSSAPSSPSAPCIDPQDLSVSIHVLSTAVGNTHDETQAPLTSEREDLSLRLRKIFQFDESERVSSCHPCWLFRGIVLQGHMYVMTSQVCFYAYLPSKEDRVLRAGSLRKRTKHTHRFSKHWAVLRGRALSWYDSERDPYFPQDHIDLRNITAVESSPPSSATEGRVSSGRFQIHTPYRVFTFETNSFASRDNWVLALRKAVFRAQNEGESVRISIPFETIIDVDGSENGLSSTGPSPVAVEQAQDMMTIKVVGAPSSSPTDSPVEEDFSMDEYIFLNVTNQNDTIRKLRERLIEHARDHRTEAVFSPEQSTSSLQAKNRPKILVRDSTSTLKSSLHPGVLDASARPDYVTPQEDCSSRRSCASQGESEGKRLDEALFGSTPRPNHTDTTLESTASLQHSLSESRHSYPPSLPRNQPPPSLPPSKRGRSYEGWNVPQWIKDASNIILTTKGAPGSWPALSGKLPQRAVHESWSSRPTPHSRSFARGWDSSYDSLEGRGSGPASTTGPLGQSDDLSNSGYSSYSLLEGPDGEAEQEEETIRQHFRDCFALPETEELLSRESQAVRGEREE